MRFILKCNTMHLMAGRLRHLCGCWSSLMSVKLCSMMEVSDDGYEQGGRRSIIIHLLSSEWLRWHKPFTSAHDTWPYKCSVSVCFIISVSILSVWWPWEGDGEVGDAVVRRADWCLRLWSLCFCVFLFLCSPCPFEHAPRARPAKNPLLLFTAGHGECGTVHQAKSHRLAGGTGMVRRSAVSYRK